MPNYKEHANTGAIVGGTAGFLLNLSSQLVQMNKFKRQRIDCSELLLSTLGGTIVGTYGGAFPDMIEPAKNNPRHRKFFHSITVASLIGYGVYKLNTQPGTGGISQGAITTLAAGYMSHLILDYRTPSKLPLI